MADKNDEMEIVDPRKPGFVEKVTAMKPPETLMMLKCQRVLPKPPSAAPPPAPQEPGYPHNIEVEGGHPYRTAPPPEEPKNLCNGVHFRHAGYIHTMLPFMRSNQEKKVELQQYQVMVCVKCRASYVWVYDQLYDVSEHIDLEAWEKLEKEAHKATGPGGQC